MKHSLRIARITGAIGCVVFLVALQVYRQSGRTVQQPVETPSADHLVQCVQAQPAPVAPLPGASLTDVSDDVGLDFRHAVGPVGTYFMPESVGSGGAIHDFDGDGKLDLYLINAGRSPGITADFPKGTRTENRLFRQIASGKFVDATAESGLGDTGYGMGCAVGDVDNDGDPDLFITNYGPDRLYLNTGTGAFLDYTAASGLDNPEWGTSAAFFDYDRDGWLDLIVVNYTADPEYRHAIACGFRAGLASYCSPRKFLPTVDRLFRNEGLAVNPAGEPSVRFADVTKESGLAAATTYGFGVVCGDFTDDGWPDIFVSNDEAPNRLWINQQNGTFLEEASLRGVAVNGNGAVEAGMGVAVGDVNRDGRLDIAVTHLTGESTTLYLADSGGQFTDGTASARLRSATGNHTGWGVRLIDLDHDGLLDLPIVNGLVVPCHSRFPMHGEDGFVVRHDRITNEAAFWRDYADRNLVLAGGEHGDFRDRQLPGGDFCASVESGRGLIGADFDDDGDVDLLVTNCGSRARLYRNDYPKKGHWLTVRPIDPQLKRDAYGARVSIRLGDRWVAGLASPAGSYLSSNDVRVHFGLGSATDFDELRVEWPSGPVETSTETFPGGNVDRHLSVMRGSGIEGRTRP